MRDDFKEKEIEFPEVINSTMKLYSTHWLSKKDDVVDFSVLNKHQEFVLKDSISRFGTPPMIDQEIIQVKSRPIKAYSYMGWRDFKTNTDYVIYMLLLAFLQDKNSTDQFLLSEAVESISEDETLIDLKKQAHRSALTNALKKLIHLSLIEVEDGNTDSFLKEFDGTTQFFEEFRADVLYNVTDLLITIGPIVPSKYEDYDTFNEWNDANPTPTLTTRQQAYIRLMTEPAIFRNHENKECLDYIKAHEDELQEYFQAKNNTEATHYELEIVSDYAALISTKKGGRQTFPAQNSTIDEVLMELAYQVWCDDLTDHITAVGSLALSEQEFNLLVEHTIYENSQHWYANMRKESPTKLQQRLIQRGKMMGLIDVKDATIYLLPTLGRLLGIINQKEEAIND